MFAPILPKFRTESWPVRRLIDIYQQHRLDLNPHYQRNAIWTTSAQKKLIETVQHGYPIPNFFVRTRPEQKFEMVDGQQRGRTLKKECVAGVWIQVELTKLQLQSDQH